MSFRINPMYISNLIRLNKIALLKDNWNGYGAEKFSSEIIKNAKKLLKNLSKQPRIYPTARNSIQFEYYKASGDCIELELFESGKLVLFYCYDTPLRLCAERQITIEEANMYVKKFYKHRKNRYEII